MTSALLAAIRFDRDDIDSLLADIAETLTRQGQCVRGVLQSRGGTAQECHCADMDLQSIGSHRRFRISQPLGNGSRGCRLHLGALAECSAFLESELHSGADLLILNRFGRGESEGRGFRDLIGAAIAREVPVLTALRPTYVEAWTAFGADLACNLPMDRDAVLDWFVSTGGGRHVG